MDNTHRPPTILGIPVEIAFAIFAFFVAINLVYLDILIAHLPTTPKILPDVSATSVIKAPQNTSCPDACLAKIQSLSTQTAPSLPTTPPPTPPVTVTPTRTPASTVREFFVPFGAGSGVATDWTDIAGLSASIDTTNYSRLKTVVFEATIRIPTGNETAYARLFNVTDAHPVWYSDVSVDGGTAKLAVSPAITLDSGNKTYQVQLKTSLGSEAFIDQARLHIVTY